MSKRFSNWHARCHKISSYKISKRVGVSAALRHQGSLTLWFDGAMGWEAEPSGRQGRQQRFSDAAIQTCLTLKVLFRLPLRQTTGLVASLLELAGLDWEVPNFSTLSRRQQALDIELPKLTGSGPLHLLVDSTGIRVKGGGEGGPRKRLAVRKRLWCKVHISIHGNMLTLRAMKISLSKALPSAVGGGPVLPDLLSRIPEAQEMPSISADGA